ncbi:MAG: hypothetical protein OES32_15230 [Acidobacteriota bacterium]|nr:hypothetical protein [Acidobacteriota bacterium]MDH3524934.1 hypothetical protein [Acidobacteriota bacterium]
MDASDRGALALLAAGVFLACGSAGERRFETRPTEAKAEIERTKQAADAEPGAGAEAPPPPAPSPPPAPDTSAAIDSTAPVAGPTGATQFKTATVEEPAPAAPTLFEASEAERRRREQTPPARVVITDANLEDYATAGRLTELVTEDRGEEDEAPVASEEESDPEGTWRRRARDARLAWRAAADRVVELEERVAKLRWDFYAADDGYHRDAVIKPEWDRAAIELEQERLRVEEMRLQLDRVLAEGRLAGALPGWLREGLEFEPAAAAGDRPFELETAEPIEPPIAAEPPR